MVRNIYVRSGNYGSSSSSSSYSLGFRYFSSSKQHLTISFWVCSIIVQQAARTQSVHLLTTHHPVYAHSVQYHCCCCIQQQYIPRHIIAMYQVYVIWHRSCWYVASYISSFCSHGHIVGTYIYTQYSSLSCRDDMHESCTRHETHAFQEEGNAPHFCVVRYVPLQIRVK